MCICAQGVYNVCVFKCIRCRCVWDRVLLCSSGWPRTGNPPASASWVLARFPGTHLNTWLRVLWRCSWWAVTIGLTPVTGSLPWPCCILPLSPSVDGSHRVEGANARMLGLQILLHSVALSNMLLAFCSFCFEFHTSLGWEIHPSSANASDKAGVEETPAGLSDGLLGVGSYTHLHLLPVLWVPLRGSQCPDHCIPSFVFSLWASAGGGPALLPLPSLTGQHLRHPQISKYALIILYGKFSYKVFSSTFLNSQVP